MKKILRLHYYLLIPFYCFASSIIFSMERHNPEAYIERSQQQIRRANINIENQQEIGTVTKFHLQCMDNNSCGINLTIDENECNCKNGLNKTICKTNTMNLCFGGIIGTTLGCGNSCIASIQGTSCCMIPSGAVCYTPLAAGVGSCILAHVITKNCCKNSNGL